MARKRPKLAPRYEVNVSLKAWDIAGGALIVSEAGGRVTMMDGAPFSSRGGNVLATNGHVHDPMLEVIRRFRNR